MYKILMFCENCQQVGGIILNISCE